MMIHSVDIYGRISMFIAAIGLLIPFAGAFYISSPHNIIWVYEVYILFILSTIALIFGLLGKSTVPGQIGFVLAIFLLLGLLSYVYHPSKTTVM